MCGAESCAVERRRGRVLVAWSGMKSGSLTPPGIVIPVTGHNDKGERDWIDRTVR